MTQFPEGYRPVTVYVPKKEGVYHAKITVGEDYEQVEWLDEFTEAKVTEGELEVIDGYIQIAIDRKTLPKDGQRVKFRTDKEEWYEGYFVEGDDIFHVTDSVWFFKWYVHEWKYI